jgi:predicted SnoaL-like aldol condensation-catalyzing enzyme
VERAKPLRNNPGPNEGALVTQFNDSMLQQQSWTVKRGEMSESTAAKNKAIVLEAFDTLFNKRDYAAAERFWSPKYIQHSAHIAPGREGLFELIRNLPPTLKYEPGAIVAEGNFVIVHGRFSGFGAPANWIAADILRIEDGILVEHWDVIQDEATEEQSKSGAPMFGKTFPKYKWIVPGRLNRIMNAFVPASLARKMEADLLGKGLASKSAVATARGEAWSLTCDWSSRSNHARANQSP